MHSPHYQLVSTIKQEKYSHLKHVLVLIIGNAVRKLVKHILVYRLLDNSDTWSITSEEVNVLSYNVNQFK